MTPPGTDTITGSVAAELRAILARQNVSGRTLAARLEVAHTWTARRLTGQTQLTVDDVVVICRALDVDPMVVLDHALAAAS